MAGIAALLLAVPQTAAQVAESAPLQLLLLLAEAGLRHRNEQRGRDRHLGETAPW